MTEERQFTIKLPMRMQVNKGGELESLNLNVYRNLHYYKLNHQKRAFQEFVKPLLSGLPSMEAVSLRYEINPKGGSRLDTMNVGSIVDKFFSDALVLNGIIPDDDYKHVVENSFFFGSLYPNDPHVLVTITETKPRKETPMRILLDQQEIQQALETFVQTMGLSGASGVELTVVGDEIQAEIIMNGPSGWSTINDAASPAQPSKRRGRIPGSKNKPKEPVNVATDSEAGNDFSGSGDSEEREEEDLDSTSEDEDQSEDSGVDLFGESSDNSDEETDGIESEESSNRSSSNRGNLFGDSDNGSSEDTDPEEEDLRPSTEKTSVKEKRPSIFDAD
jgi:hypothetical protein